MLKYIDRGLHLLSRLRPDEKSTGARDATLQELLLRISERPRLREAFDPARHGKNAYVVSGGPRDWDVATKELKAAGCDILGYHDLSGSSTATTFNERPVYRRLEDAPRHVRVVLPHRPSKRQFSPCPPGLDRCLWLRPPGEKHQRMGADPDLLRRLEPRVLDLYAALADEPSRDAFASVLKARIQGDAGFYLPALHREYDHPVVRAEAGDVVIDGGAYDGDTAALFARQVGEHGTVLAIEPSARNLSALMDRLRNESLTNVIPVFAALWNQADSLAFEPDQGGSSAVTGKGSARVPALTIDSIVQMYRLPRVDLIKLDVEGAEAKALEGAQETIRRFRPKLQISVYHKRDDIVELAEQVRPLLRNYQFYFAHHNFYYTESDVYAIPIERAVRSRLGTQARRLARTVWSDRRVAEPGSLRSGR